MATRYWPATAAFIPKWKAAIAPSPAHNPFMLSMRLKALVIVTIQSAVMATLKIRLGTNRVIRMPLAATRMATKTCPPNLIVGRSSYRSVHPTQYQHAARAGDHPRQFPDPAAETVLKDRGIHPPGAQENDGRKQRGRQTGEYGKSSGEGDGLGVDFSVSGIVDMPCSQTPGPPPRQ
jgi:hypothetical protein